MATTRMTMNQNKTVNDQSRPAGLPAGDVSKKGRRIVLFPGAFRPPHKAHFNTVASLSARADIDEVVIIITNRCRHIPGTDSVLENQIAEQIWGLYLQDLNTSNTSIRVEIAAQSAVKHALGYFETSQQADTLLFCAGEKEFKRGTGRFSKIEQLSRKYAISASVIPSPVAELAGGATSMRTHLAAGYAGRDAFMKCLPSHLSRPQCNQVWRLCREGMTKMTDVAIDHIQQILKDNGFNTITSIECLNHNKPDPVFCVLVDNGKRYFVKYANNTVKADQLGKPHGLKPRNRLYAERRVLKCLGQQHSCQIKIPDVVCFDNKTKTLILEDVSRAGRLLEDDLKQGIFDPHIARQTSLFLAMSHSTQPPDEAFWGSHQADREHWETMLRLATIDLKETNSIPISLFKRLGLLHDASLKAAQCGVYHLDYNPRNIFVTNSQVSVIDFEMSSSIGDPAFDLGCLVGHYLCWGLINYSRKQCLTSLCEMLDCYRNVMTGKKWVAVSERILPFAATSIISRLIWSEPTLNSGLCSRLLGVATTLLVSGHHQKAVLQKIFTDDSAHLYDADERQRLFKETENEYS